MKKKLVWICGILLVISISLGVWLLSINKDNSSNNSNSNNSNLNSNELKELPLPEVTGGSRGELGIDKNINESNIDDYLNRGDSVYRDMRMLEDPANYESIGGDRYLSGYIKGFEVVPLPYLIPVDGLPESVGKTYSGKTLFSKDSNGNYVANYEESLSILEELFPKDKVIFLMCGGGGYAGMTKNLLVSLGYDENKIYNIGGYWYYEGKNNVEVKKVVDGKTTYDFGSVPYHKIEFDKLTLLKNNSNVTSNNITSNSNVTSNNTSNNINSNINSNNTGSKATLSSEFYNYNENKVPVNSVMYEFDLIDTRDGMWLGHYPCGEDTNKTNCFEDRTAEEYEKDRNTAIEKKGEIVNQLLKEKKSFVVTVNAGDTCISYGTAPDSFDRYALEYLRKKNIYAFSMGFLPFKKTKLYNTVKYNPAVIIIKDGEIYKYVDSNMDEFVSLGKNSKTTAKWLEENIVIK